MVDRFDAAGSDRNNRVVILTAAVMVHRAITADRFNRFGPGAPDKAHPSADDSELAAISLVW